jgi:hypothetical protein
MRSFKLIAGLCGPSGVPRNQGTQEYRYGLDPDNRSKFRRNQPQSLVTEEHQKL